MWKGNLNTMMQTASDLRDQGHGNIISYSRKVFIPLTRLCRDVCHYCTYAQAPRDMRNPYMSRDEVLAVARAGEKAGCKEALFTLGDKPELRYRVAREALAELGCKTTIDYVAQMADLVIQETGLLPHINAGVLTSEDLVMLREVSASQGLMLESTSTGLCEEGGPHEGSPDKLPQRRLDTIRLAGELRVPFTSGLLIGIGESRSERLESLHALHDLHCQYGHIQEIIIQSFRAKPGTLMANATEPGLDELQWTITRARLLFGPEMNIQAPPNLNAGNLHRLVDAGINDWGGVSPVTPDFVNPEAPWPHLASLAEQTVRAGKTLVERLAVYPSYLHATVDWVAPAVRSRALRMIDSEGYARTDAWSAGHTSQAPYDLPSRSRRASTKHLAGLSNSLVESLKRAQGGDALSESNIVELFSARGTSFDAVCEAAETLREIVNGDTVGYVVNRNINYTNICYFGCGFCAFSKGKHSETLRGPSYDIELEEIARRTREAHARGATEVCMQGGIHPQYTGQTYLEICRAVKDAVPEMHVHAFSALEIWQGAETMGLSVARFLEQLQTAGLDTLPGTAAEILDDEIRAVICPDKINTKQWLDVIGAAHDVGLKTTSTIMFGHVDQPRHWARHLLRLRALQRRTGGITEFVPLPFVHLEAPLYRQGMSRMGPTYRESVLMHAVARLSLHPYITNIQTSWTKMGINGARACLQAGANDLGGTLMNESISRAAGSIHGQELSPRRIQQVVDSLQRIPQQRTTLYGTVSDERSTQSFDTVPLEKVDNTTVSRPQRRPSGFEKTRLVRNTTREALGSEHAS